jgi:hypothetical protein
MNNQGPPLRRPPSEAELKPEKEVWLETFGSFYRSIGPDQTAQILKNNDK